MNLRKLCICILAALLAVAMVPGTSGGTGALPVQAASALEQEIADLEKEQAELETQIQELRKQHDASAEKVDELLAQKNLIDQEIFLLVEQLELTDQRIVSCSALVAQTNGELEQAEQELKQMQARNAQRIRAMEKSSQLDTYWAVIFGAEDFIELLDMMKLYADIQASDKAILDQLTASAKVVRDKKAELESQHQELETAKQNLLDTQATLEQRAMEADDLLKKAKQEEEDFRAQLEKSEDEQDALARKLAQSQERLENMTRPSNGWLVPCSYVYVSSPFGNRYHPLSGIYKMHYGIDLAAYQGTPIYATRSGKVTEATYNDSAGYYVYINHGDGYGSIYMHMTHYVVSAGQYVDQGQVIGYVGSTGGSTGPHLHFGISKNGVYVDPADYIRV